MNPEDYLSLINGLDGLAMMLKTYYESFTRAGFTDDEAFEFTMQLHEKMIEKFLLKP